jgi:hypothetical protein
MIMSNLEKKTLTAIAAVFVAVWVALAIYLHYHPLANNIR